MKSPLLKKTIKDELVLTLNVRYYHNEHQYSTFLFDFPSKIAINGNLNYEFLSFRFRACNDHRRSPVFLLSKSYQIHSGKNSRNRRFIIEIFWFGANVNWPACNLY
tara:strand:- start:1320 stop:1637 length:318 start_codon:yes stop_codon:yes gene_type:complete